MREELQNFNWFVYGLDAEDLNYTFRLINDMVKARIELLHQQAAKIREEQPDMAEDILDDISYYVHVDTEYFWHFCLWRLQGIFEGIITTKYLSNHNRKRLFGLKAKLDAMMEFGYLIEPEAYNELLAWGEFRNALSHCPPEKFRPVVLYEKDIIEYMNLLKKVLKAWKD